MGEIEDALAYWRGTGCLCLDILEEQRRTEEIRSALVWKKTPEEELLEQKRSGMIYPEDMGGL